MVGSQLSAPTPQSVPPPPAHLHLETIELPSTDGGVIRGRYGYADDAIACVLLLHGVRSHRGEMLSRAEFLLQHRFSVVLIDFQAHGESSGEAITFGYREAANVDAAVAFVRSRTPNMPLVALGFSLGGAATVLSVSVLKFDGLILEAVYPTIEQAITNRLRMRLGTLAAWLTPLLTGQLAWRLHITPQQLAPQIAIQRVTCPVLIIGGVMTNGPDRKIHEPSFTPCRPPKNFGLFQELRMKISIMPSPSRMKHGFWRFCSVFSRHQAEKRFEKLYVLFAFL